MSYKKILQLADKFAEKSQNEQFQEQRAMLEKFSDEYLNTLKSILGEMEGDLLTLKEKGFPRAKWKEFGLFWKELVEIYKSYDESQPYEGAKKLLLFVASKSKESFIRTLNAEVHKFLKEKEVDFGAGADLSQSEVNSLRRLWDFSNRTAKTMVSNPLLPDPRELITTPPPRVLFDRNKETVVDDVTK